MVQLFIALFENGTHPITIRKETSKTKCKQTFTAEILIRHERGPIDRRVAGFKHIFY